MQQMPAAGWSLSPDPLLQDPLQLWASRALAAGQQLGVFAELAKGPRTAARLADALGLALEPARDLLDALLALGWLQREGDDAAAVYVSSRNGAQFLDPRSPAYLGDLLLAARAPWTGGPDSLLDDALRQPPHAAAAPAPRQAGDGAAALAAAASVPDDWDTARQLMRQRLGALYGDALAQLPGLPLPGLPLPAPAPGAAAATPLLLDLGGEGGRLACAWAARSGRAARVLTLQPPAQLPAVLAHVQACGLASRVRVRADPHPGTGTGTGAGAGAGTRSTLALPRADRVVLSLLLDRGDEAARRQRLQRAAQALSPGAWLLLLDHLADDARREHVPALVFGLAARMTGQGHGALTEGRLRADCQALGLLDGPCLPLPGGASVLCAQQAVG